MELRTWSLFISSFCAGEIFSNVVLQSSGMKLDLLNIIELALLQVKVFSG